LDPYQGATGQTTFPAGATIDVVSATISGTVTGCSGDTLDLDLNTDPHTNLVVGWNIPITTDPQTLNNAPPYFPPSSSGALTAATNLYFIAPFCTTPGGQPVTPGGSLTFDITFTVTPPPTPYS